jgi:hypothetical protein
MSTHTPAITGMIDMLWKKIPPMTATQRAAVIEALAFVEQLLILRKGVRDAGVTLSLCQNFIRALELPMPQMAYPCPETRREQSLQDLSNREIDLIFEQLEKAAEVYRYHITARVSDIARKFEQHLATIRGREYQQQKVDQIKKSDPTPKPPQPPRPELRLV